MRRTGSLMSLKQKTLLSPCRFSLSLSLVVPPSPTVAARHHLSSPPSSPSVDRWYGLPAFLPIVLPLYFPYCLPPPHKHPCKMSDVFESHLLPPSLVVRLLSCIFLGFLALGRFVTRLPTRTTTTMTTMKISLVPLPHPRAISIHLFSLSPQ